MIALTYWQAFLMFWAGGVVGAFIYRWTIMPRERR